MAKRGKNIHKQKDGRWERYYINGRINDGKLICGYLYCYAYSEVKEKLTRQKIYPDFIRFLENLCVFQG